MNIAFVANGDKCAFFDLIGKSIKDKMNDVNIYWICISRKQYNYLLSNGYKPEDILLINWDVRNNPQTMPIGEYKLHELVWGDRRMKHHFEDGLKYLTNIQLMFHSFVEEKKLRYIFGEMTWAHEILMNRICKDKFAGKCYYLHPQSIRIPNGRFVFMDSEFQNTIFSLTENIQPESELKDFEIPIKPVVPERVADVAKDVKSRLNVKYTIERILGFFIFNRFKNHNRDSLQSLKYSLHTRIGMFIKEEWNKLYYSHWLKKVNFTSLESKKFFFVTLHMQPEASVDVVGRYYEDQFEMIRNVWRILPNDYYLVVKEHTNAIGNRGRTFFKKCLSLKNILIVDEQESSHRILNLSETVFTNSGTVALEGALYGKDVFVFSEIFFGKISNCHKISLEDLKFSSNYFQMLDNCKKRDMNKMTISEYSKYILQSSFSGVIDPHDGSHYFTDVDNVNTIAEGFVKLLTQTNECK